MLHSLEFLVFLSLSSLSHSLLCSLSFICFSPLCSSSAIWLTAEADSGMEGIRWFQLEKLHSFCILLWTLLLSSCLFYSNTLKQKDKDRETFAQSVWSSRTPFKKFPSTVYCHHQNRMCIFFTYKTVIFLTVNCTMHSTFLLLADSLDFTAAVSLWKKENVNGTYMPTIALLW